MTTFVLIPGAGGVAWYWHRLQPLIDQAGHEALAVDLPGDDAHAGLSAYADLVIAPIGDRGNVALVAQSMGGFTSALVCARARKSLRMLVFVNAMIPLPCAWPDIPIHVVVGKDDRFFPSDFQARVARDRLGKVADEIPGGHLVALSHPRELAERLLAYAAK